MKKNTLVVTLTAFSIMSSAFVLKSIYDEEPIGFKVKDINNKEVIYSTIIDTNYFDDTYANNHRGIVFASNTKNICYTEEHKNIKEKLNLVIPLEWSSCGYTLDTIYYNNYNFDYVYQENDYKDCYNKEIKVIYSEVIAKNNVYDLTLKPVINKGDSISSIMITYNGKPVIYNQYGVGSKDKFISDNNYGDATMALADISVTFDMDTNMEISYASMMSEMLSYNDLVYGMKK